MAEIRIDRIAKSFGAMRALDEIVLDVADGEFVALLGPSGCGKTTLLRIIAGLETQSAGRIIIGGRDITDVPVRARRLAMVFQNYAVFPHMTVYENIAFGLRMQSADDARVERQVTRVAELLHIETVLDRYPAKLSGGQRQRVAVARALAAPPPRNARRTQGRAARGRDHDHLRDPRSDRGDGPRRPHRADAQRPHRTD